MTNTLDKITRLAKFIICFAIAVFVFWRGNRYEGTSVLAIPELMCALFAIALTLVGFSLATDGSNE